MSEFISIKNWAAEDRPREKLLEKGTEALSNAELIAILLGSGTTNESAVELAKRILQAADNSLNQLGKQSINDLKQHKGIGEAKAITIIAALELGRRRKVADVMERKIIRTSQDIFELMQPILADIPHEEFWIILLNNASKLIAKHKLSTGGISATVVDVRLLMKIVLDNYASSIVIVHNHPSNNLTPSKHDLDITHQIVEACHFFGIICVDHLIIGETNFYSFADNEELY